MIKQLLIFSLKKRWVIIAISAMLMVIGFFSFRELKIEAYPDIADTNVIVIAQFPGRASEEVEQQVTIPIERALQNTPNILDRRSRTIFGLSVVQLTFKDGTDDYFARQQVIERLSAAQLPDGVLPELAPLSTAVGEILRYVVDAPSAYTPTELRDLQDWVIKPSLLQVPGIADVVTFGGPMKQFHILTAPEKLRKYDLKLSDIINSINENNKNTGGGIIARGGQGFAIRGLGAIKDIKDIENIVIKADNGFPVYVKDVASIEITPPSPSGVLGYKTSEEKEDVKSGVEGIILLRRYENPSEVLEKLKAKINDIESNELPAEVNIKPLYDRSFLIDHSLETVAHTLFEGISIVVIILIFFLGSFRSALVVAITIPFSLLFAFILMHLTGIPANLLSLGAIDFGIIVDGACVMTEYLIRKYRSATPEEKRQGIIKITLMAAQEVGKEIFFSVTIIILAYMPILLMTRVEGKLFSPMALTLAFAVIGSMIASLTFIPVLISFVYKKDLQDIHKEIKKPKNYLLDKIDKGYEHLMKKLMVNYKKTTIVTASIVILLSLWSFKLGTEFLPPLDEGSIFLRANFPSGITIQENAKYAPKIRRIISKYPQVDFVITQSGRNDDGTDPFPANRNEILIGLKNYDLWSDKISKKDLVSKIKDDLKKNLPGVSINSGQPIIDQVMEIVTGSAADLAVSIVGDNLTVMRQKADSIVEIVNNTRGSDNVNIEQEGPQDQLAIDIDRTAAARYGINIADIQNMIEAAIGGKTISTLYDNYKRYDIVIRFLPQYRNSIDDIKNLQIPSISGSMIPVSQLANVHFVQGQTNIYHYGSKRMITVRTNIKNRDQGSFVRELQKKIEHTISIPRGYRLMYGGQFENLERASSRLLVIVPLVLIGVFIILIMLYKGDLRDASLAMSCVLFSLPGGVCFLLFRGYYFNISAGVGFVSLFGIAIMTGILFVSAFKLKQEEGKLSLFNAILDSSVEQINVRIMVITLAVMGLVPAAISYGIGSDVQRPLATVIIGGLISTMIFAPILLPSIYYWTEKKRVEKKESLGKSDDFDEFED